MEVETVFSTFSSAKCRKLVDGWKKLYVLDLIWSLYGIWDLSRWCLWLKKKKHKKLAFQRRYIIGASTGKKGQPIMTSFLFMGLNIKGESTAVMEDEGRDWLVIPYRHTVLALSLWKWIVSLFFLIGLTAACMFVMLVCCCRRGSVGGVVCVLGWGGGI